MPRKPKIASVEDLSREIQAYCARYGAQPGPSPADPQPGPAVKPLPPLPVFPAGLQESVQHREWLALYKARARLARAAPQG